MGIIKLILSALTVLALTFSVNASAKRLTAEQRKQIREHCHEEAKGKGRKAHRECRMKAKKELKKAGHHEDAESIDTTPAGDPPMADAPAEETAE